MDLIIVKFSIINTWGKVITDIPTIKNKRLRCKVLLLYQCKKQQKTWIRSKGRKYNKFLFIDSILLRN